MHQGAFLGGGGWARGGGGGGGGGSVSGGGGGTSISSGGTGVVRRAHPASGAQWNVQVVRGKVNGRCLWNACKALSLGLLLMVLGAAMATMLLSLCPGAPGFIVVAACVMTFEARDSAAKVVPARFKLGSQAAVAAAVAATPGSYPAHRTAGSQTALTQMHSHQRSVRHHGAPVQPVHDRAALTQAFVRFSRGLASLEAKRRSVSSTGSTKIIRSPSAPNLNMHRGMNSEQGSPSLVTRGPIKPSPRTSRRTFAACALLNPGLLHRHALSVDETAPHYRYSNESLGHASQEDVGSLAMDLHLPNDCPVTLRVRDRTKPRRPLCRQRPVVMDEEAAVPGPSGVNGAGGTDEGSRRGSHTSPRMQHVTPAHHWLPPSTSRRSSNASDCTHRPRARRRDCPHSRGRLERAISSDSRLTGATARCHHHTAPLLAAAPTPNTSPSNSLAEDDGAQSQQRAQSPHDSCA